MQHDDLISVFEFFTRQQLIRLLLVNHSIFSFINKHFANKPMIYTNLSLFKGYPDPLGPDEVEQTCQFCLHLTALNCCCEQQQAFEDDTFWNLYKYSIACTCDKEGSLHGTANEKGTDVWYEDYNHRECTNWQEVKEPLIEINQYRRRTRMLQKLLRKYYEHNDITDYWYTKASSIVPKKKTDCCTIWKHKIHSEIGRKRIYEDFKYEHRIQRPPGWRECDALELRSGDIAHVLRHLELAYVKINRLDLWREDSEFGYVDRTDKSEEKPYTDEECRKFYDVLLWLMDNKKISPGAFIIVEMRFMVTMLDRLNVGAEERGRLLDTISQCMHLEITITVEEPLPYAFVDNNILQKAMLTEFHCRFSIDQVRELIKAYNPQHDWHRLLVFCWPKDTRKIVDKILEDFHNSDNRTTFFILIHAILEANKNIDSIHWNQKTNEILRVMPAIRYSLNSRECVPIYMARYSAFNSVANEEHGSFFSVLKNNLSELEAAVTRAMIEDGGKKFSDNWNESTTRDYESVRWILYYAEVMAEKESGPNFDFTMTYSCGPFFARIFPRLAAGNVARSDNKFCELFNADAYSDDWFGRPLNLNELLLPSVHNVIRYCHTESSEREV